LSKLPLLIIEDDPKREEKLCSWLTPDFRPIVARSAGAALGILARDKGSVLKGIVLDHDLEKQPMTEKDRSLNGQDIVKRIIQNISKDTQILVHSVNYIESPIMVRQLVHAGFDVLRIPMSDLEKESFQEWLNEVRENHG
jgi:hypothetical protein